MRRRPTPSLPHALQCIRRAAAPAGPPAPDLPPEVFANIARFATLPDLLAASTASRAWRANALASLPPLAARRWRRAAPPLSSPGAAPAECFEPAAAAHARDARVLACLRAMGASSGEPREAALDEICDLAAADGGTLDALERAAAWADPRLVGLRHWARAALPLAAAARALPRLRGLMAKAAPEPDDMFEAALALVRSLDERGGGGAGRGGAGCRAPAPACLEPRFAPALARPWGLGLLDLASAMQPATCDLRSAICDLERRSRSTIRWGTAAPASGASWRRWQPSCACGSRPPAPRLRASRRAAGPRGRGPCRPARSAC